MKLTLGLIFFSVLVAVNSVTGANPKHNYGPVYNRKGKPYQVIVEEGEFCDNYYLICNPDVKRKKYLACVYDRRLKRSYCKKVDVYYDPPKNQDPPKKETIPTDHKPKNDEATKPIVPKPKNDEATKGSGNNANGMAQNNPIGGSPGAAKADKKPKM